MQNHQLVAKYIAVTISSFYVFLLFGVRLIGALVNGYKAFIPENNGLIFGMYGYAVGYICSFKKPLLGGLIILLSTMGWELELIKQGANLSPIQLFFTLLPALLFVFSSWSKVK